MFASAPDLLRLAVLPAFAWAARRDVRTRRLPNRLWYPLAALGVALLLVELFGRLPLDSPLDRLFLLRVGVSLALVVPLSYGFWRLGGFGGADAKALMTLAVLVPTLPTYAVGGTALPVAPSRLGVLSLTALTNAVLLAGAYPLVLAARNALAGRFSRAMALARPVSASALPTTHGRLFERREGFARAGLDLDALRMYLRWRGTTLDALRAAPDRHRDPASVGATRDPWGAEAFLDSFDGSAYGTTPGTLREGLDLLAERDAVWVSPGLPFLVPLFVGLLVGFVYGDLLFGLLGAVGAV